MDDLQHLLDNNRRWAERIEGANPGFFAALAQQQTPQYLWIGCSDSRVPANQIVDLMPGELFVHRNVANVVNHTDLNLLSVLQFSIEVLRVRHVIVCGHYGCGGVRAALEDEPHGLIDNWLQAIKDVRRHEWDQLAPLPSDERVNRLCELNVMAQVENVAQTTVVQDAWRRGQSLTIHGWIYSIGDGILRDLHVSTDGARATT
jgi:carbonic anhydrase